MVVTSLVSSDVTLTNNISPLLQEATVTKFRQWVQLLQRSLVSTLPHVLVTSLSRSQVTDKYWQFHFRKGSVTKFGQHIHFFKVIYYVYVMQTTELSVFSLILQKISHALLQLSLFLKNTLHIFLCFEAFFNVFVFLVSVACSFITSYTDQNWLNSMFHILKCCNINSKKFFCIF